MTSTPPSHSASGPEIGTSESPSEGQAQFGGGSDAALSWSHATVTYGDRRVVDDVSLVVPRGCWLSLLGPNGAGKTTLLRTLGQLRCQGQVQILGRDLADLTPSVRAQMLAVVAQLPTIPPGIGTFDYVALGRAPHQGIRYAPSIEDRRRSLAVLQRLDLEAFARRAVDTLSGGERQRVVLARALVQDTPILVLDEPTTALDVGHQLDVLELVADLRSETDLTVVTTIHDLSLAGQFADRVAVLADGALVAEGEPSAVLTPDLISTHWGVEADVDHETDGAVTVTVRRRRESRRTETRPSDKETT